MAPYKADVGNTTRMRVTPAQLQGWLKEHSSPQYIRDILDPIVSALETGKDGELCFAVTGGNQLAVNTTFAGSDAG